MRIARCGFSPALSARCRVAFRLFLNRRCARGVGPEALAAQRAVERPSETKTLAQPGYGNTNNLCPLAEHARFAVVGYPANAASVTRLFGARRPSAILRTVGTVIVDAIKRVSRRWTLAHVLKEHKKTELPFGAHANPTPAVVGILGIAWVSTAGFHPRPNDPLRSFRESVLAIHDSFYHALNVLRFWKGPK